MGGGRGGGTLTSMRLSSSPEQTSMSSPPPPSSSDDTLSTCRVQDNNSGHLSQSGQPFRLTLKIGERLPNNKILTVTVCMGNTGVKGQWCDPGGQRSMGVVSPGCRKRGYCCKPSWETHLPTHPPPPARSRGSRRTAGEGAEPRSWQLPRQRSAVRERGRRTRGAVERGLTLSALAASERRVERLRRGTGRRESVESNLLVGGL